MGFFAYSERLVWLAISLLGAGRLREAPGFALFVRARLRSESHSRANRSAVYAATELVCVLSEEREQQSLLPELPDSIGLPPGPENQVYKRKIKHTQTLTQIWEVSEIRFCCSEENLNLNLNVGCAWTLRPGCSFLNLKMLFAVFPGVYHPSTVYFSLNEVEGRVCVDRGRS